MKITQFYTDEYSASANYQSFRSIASYIDGLKNGARKIIYTIDKNNIISDIKVSQLSSKVAELTEYLHGETSLYSTIVGLAQTFPGSNNINLLQPEGNFGTRFIQEASAGRYIYTKKSKYFDKIFMKEDRDILISQDFEGKQIEPKFYVPIIPMILVNGSEGIGNGFAQKILPRDEKKIIDVILTHLRENKKITSIIPHMKGFHGKIEIINENDSTKILMSGKIDIINSNTLRISEIPTIYDLQSYIKILNKLEEDKIIKGYSDKSENDIYQFDIDVTREFAKTPHDELLKIFKLTKSFTENFTCVDENNAIVEFKNEKELLASYIKIRLDYYSKRKKYILSKLLEENTLLENKIKFIEKINSGEIIVSNKSKTDIEKQLVKLKIKKINNDYEYLLKMSIYSLTKEKIEELKEILSQNKKKIEELQLKSEKDLWIEDLEELKKYL